MNNPTLTSSPIATLAIALLGYTDLGEEEKVAALLAESSSYDLGLTIQAWYHMALAYRGNAATEKIARETAQFFQSIVEGDLDNDVKLAASFARNLMLDLAAGLDDRFAELWAVIIDDHAEIITPIMALFLGFATGVLAPEEEK